MADLIGQMADSTSNVRSSLVSLMIHLDKHLHQSSGNMLFAADEFSREQIVFVSNPCRLVLAINFS